MIKTTYKEFIAPVSSLIVKIAHSIYMIQTPLVHVKTMNST